MSTKNKSKQKLDRRPTIGVLMDTMGSSYQISIWNSIRDAAETHDINLICFLGGAIGTADDIQQANAIYKMINQNNVDGLIILTGTIGFLVDQDTLTAYLNQFQPLPIVSISVELENTPSILLNNQIGVVDIVTHLIETHNYNRIGFVRMGEGYQEGDERFHAYKETLARHGLAYDPDLVVPGKYYDDAEGAVHWLFDKRQATPEALVVVDDYMALQIMEVLKGRGLSVPQDIAIVGFDDVEETRYSTPPLTTVRQPLWEEAQKAVEMVLACLAGDTVPLKLVLSPTPIIRDSCGCLQASLVQVTASIDFQETGAKALSEYQAQILAYLVDTSDIKKEQPLGELLQAFNEALGTGQAEPLLQTLKNILTEAVRRDENLLAWQSVISTLRAYAIQAIEDEDHLSLAENLIHQARVVIAEAAQREQATLRFNAQRQSQAFHNLGQELSLITDLKDLYAVLNQVIPYLGIPNYSVSFYEQRNPESETVSLVTARTQAGLAELPPEGLAYRSVDLLPKDFIPAERRFTKVVEPLIFGEEAFGFATFDGEVYSETAYDALAEQISSGIKRVDVVQEVTQRAVQQLTASEVSRAASSILDPDELIKVTANLIQERFNLYYAGIFLVDDERQWANLMAGTGEPGQKMLAENWQLAVGGDSMIGRCVSTGEPDIQLDIEQAPIHLRNPHLPKTKSEMALPLNSRGEILGALTIQSDRGNAFSAQDITVLQTMADQLANAIGNAYLYNALEREQYLMTALMDNLPEAIYFKDKQSHFVRISRYMIDNFQVKDPAEVIGKSDFDFFTEEHAQLAYKDEQRIIQTGEPLLNVEERETWKDRPNTWVVTSKLPLKNERGEIVGTFGVTRDITEQKDAQQALERQSNQLQTAIDVSRAVSEILNPESLTQQVVELIRERFNLYYVGIFLVDKLGEQAILRAGTGAAGKRMLAEGWQLEVGGNSMVGRCIELGSPDIQHDTDQAPAHLRNPHLPETKSEIALPLFSRGRVLGALTIQSAQNNAFSTQDASILQTMANQVATAIANARLFEQTQSALLETETLLNISRLISGTVEIDESLPNVLDLTLKATGIDAGLFSMLDPQTGQIRLSAHQIPEAFRQKLLAEGFENTMCALVYQQDKPLRSDNLARDFPLEGAALVELGFNSFLGVPIGSKGEVFGTLCTFHKSLLPAEQSYSTILQAIGQQVGVAIENSRLFAQTQATLAEVEAIQRRYQIQAWSSYNQRQRSSGYQQSPEGVKPLGKQKLTEVDQAINEQAPLVFNETDKLKLTVPIMLRDQPIGAVGIEAGPNKRQWTPEEIALVQEISEQFALAAESLRLLDETQRRAARERLVAEITTKLRATNDPNAMLQTAAAELKEALKAKRTQVFLQKSSSDESSPPAEEEKRGAA